MKKHTGKIIFAIVVLLMGGSIIYSQYAGNAANEGVVLAERHIKGNADAQVVLTEYADFQCPACGQFYPVMKSLEEEYGDQLAIEFKHFPLSAIHPYALPAAKAAEAAGVQGKFFEMHDKLFENQTEWSQSATPQVFFNKYAQEIELDMSLFTRHMRATLIEDRIKSEAAEAQALGHTGTPSFMLNGEKLTFETFEEFIAKIESALGIVPEATTTQTESVPEVNFGI